MQCPFHEWDCAFRPCEQHVFSPCVSSTPTPEQREWDTMLLYFAVAQRETRKVLQATHTTHTPLTHHSHTRTRTHSHTPLWERSRCKVQQQDGRREAAAGEGKLLRDSALLYNITLPTVHSSQSHHHHQSPSSSVWLLPLSHPSHTASASTSGRMVSWCSALKSFVDRSIAPSVSCPLMFGMSAGFCQQKKKQVTVRAHLSAAAAAATTAPYSLQGWAD